VVDGASSHRDANSREAIRKLGLKMVILAPYYYSGSVCELFFSQFKRGQLNPTNLKLGKR
jgi:hypothetical protein